MLLILVMLRKVEPDKVQDREGARGDYEIITYRGEDGDASVNFESVMQGENDCFDLTKK